jgi:hypothetical protein
MPKEKDFNYISEEEYKTLISIYQQKTFNLFNQNIALEAKVETLNSLVEKLTENINLMTKSQEKANTTPIIKRKQKATPAIIDKEEISNDFSEGETFN